MLQIPARARSFFGHPRVPAARKRRQVRLAPSPEGLEGRTLLTITAQYADIAADINVDGVNYPSFEDKVNQSSSSSIPIGPVSLHHSDTVTNPNNGASASYAVSVDSSVSGADSQSGDISVSGSLTASTPDNSVFVDGDILSSDELNFQLPPDNYVLSINYSNNSPPLPPGFAFRDTSSVSVSVDSKQIPLDEGQGSYKVSLLNDIYHNIKVLVGATTDPTVAYGINVSYAASCDVSWQIQPARQPNIALASSPNPSAYGQPVTFTATVSPAISGLPTPTGTVTFMDGSTALGTGTLNASGVATFTTSTLAVGKHSITAVYGGDSNFSGATSSPITQTVVTPSATQLAVTVQPPLVAGLNSPFDVRVVAEDANGNIVTSFSGYIQLDTDPFQSTVLEGLHKVQAVNGVADFPSLGINTVHAAYTLKATADGLSPVDTTPFTVALTPMQIRKAYGFDQIQFLTNPADPNYYNEHAGAGQTIAIVIDDDDPYIRNTSDPGYSSSDLALFDAEFGLPDPPSLRKIGQDINNPVGSIPTTVDPGFEKEESMDVEWAHALAPQANIIVVECTTGVTAGMLTAAEYPGVSVVSVSDDQYYNNSANINNINQLIESGYDNSNLITPPNHRGVTFVVSAGDTANTLAYPAISPNVLSVGGTNLSIAADGTYGSETGWTSSSGGVARDLESEPDYQFKVQNTESRTFPDVAFDADVSGAVAIYDSQGKFPFAIDDGTSLGAPCWAALIALANQNRFINTGDPNNTLDGPSQTLPGLYNLPTSYFHNDFTNDTISWLTGVDENNGTSTLGLVDVRSYNENSGLGTPKADLIVPALAALPNAPVRLTPSSLPADIVGVPYTQTITATGGVLSKIASYSITSSTTPANLGLVFNESISQLTISGTPTAAGTVTFAIVAIDSVGAGTTQSYTLTINPINITAQIRASRLRLVYARAGKLATGTLRITNAGTTALSGSLEIVLGGLPPGVSLANGSGHTGGGSPYVSVNLARKPLRTGHSVKVRLRFVERKKIPFKYQLTFFEA